MCDVTARGNESPFSSVLMQTWSADMSRALVCVLMAAWSLGSNGQTVHQPTRDVQTVEGETVTLECRYDSLASNDYIFWYKQEANAAPEFILSQLKLGQGKTEEKYAKRFHCRVNASTSQAPLHIDNVKPSDSGVFYCALQPTLTHPLTCLYKNTCTRLFSQVTVNGSQCSRATIQRDDILKTQCEDDIFVVNQQALQFTFIEPSDLKNGSCIICCRASCHHMDKEKDIQSTSSQHKVNGTGNLKLVFGRGTRVTVEARKEFKPSFYKMEARNLSACLATGFSQHKATAKAGKGYMFKGSRPVRISDDSLYNQLALLSHNDTCEEGDSGPGRCPDALGPDKTVNFLSIAVLALRLVFAKTLAINGVMTLRLCFGSLESPCHRLPPVLDIAFEWNLQQSCIELRAFVYLQVLCHLKKIRSEAVGVANEVGGLCHSVCCCADAAVGFKVVFGGGTRVIVERRKEFKPSFYKMESRNLSACLATGFSRHNAMAKAGKGYMFEQSRPVRISYDSLYNQVALLSHNDTCEEGDTGPGRCQDAWGPDKTVNLLSLIVLALRLVFAKMLAINGVMTLRLCFSAPK
ncbi:uncharacterized protein LOC133145645 [Syngnathus typhle]|uniref:uncharacterized protein LOC133145645 n=1 Tax=Syngnathus typhle TaxID=161592 RepID=UPI002A69E2D1|nr:uncharacterized protein LOC133145645 [Syngnathus typhle]